MWLFGTGILGLLGLKRQGQSGSLRGGTKSGVHPTSADFVFFVRER